MSVCVCVLCFALNYIYRYINYGMPTSPVKVNTCVSIRWRSSIHLAYSFGALKCTQI